MSVNSDMQLLDHVSITVRNLSGVKSFYLAVMSALGAQVGSKHFQEK